MRKKYPYDEKAKDRIMRTLEKNYEQVRLTVPKGTLQLYKDFAATKGVSMTALITSIMEREMKTAGFIKEESADE